MMRYDWLSLLELECLSKHLPQWVYRREFKRNACVLSYVQYIPLNVTAQSHSQKEAATSG